MAFFFIYMLLILETPCSVLGVEPKKFEDEVLDDACLSLPQPIPIYSSTATSASLAWVPA